MNPIIIPAILERDVGEVKKKLDLASKFTDIVQIDIADGVFVANTTLSFEQALQVTKSSKINIEWHLMFSDPLILLNSPSLITLLSGSTIIFHDEATNKPKDIISVIKKIGCKAGVALNPGTPSETIDLIANDLDMVTIMTVEPGFQGSPFVPLALKKVTEIKSRFPKLKVEIDGGINELNLLGVLDTGVDQIVMGSGLWKNIDPRAQYQKLTAQINKVI